MLYWRYGSFVGFIGWSENYILTASVQPVFETHAHLFYTGFDRRRLGSILFMS